MSDLIKKHIPYDDPYTETHKAEITDAYWSDPPPIVGIMAIYAVGFVSGVFASLCVYLFC